jgi:hypothetical protein
MGGEQHLNGLKGPDWRTLFVICASHKCSKAEMLVGDSTGVLDRLKMPILYLLLFDRQQTCSRCAATITVFGDGSLKAAHQIEDLQTGHLTQVTKFQKLQGTSLCALLGPVSRTAILCQSPTIEKLKEGFVSLINAGDYLYEYANKEYGDGSVFNPPRIPLPDKEMVSLEDYR